MSTYIYKCGLQDDPRRFFIWSANGSIQWLKHQAILKPVKDGKLIKLRRKRFDGEFIIVINGKEERITIHDPGPNWGSYFIYTDNLKGVYRCFIEADKEVCKINQEKEKDILRPILPGKTIDRIETTIFEFCEAIQAFGTAKGFGNVGIILTGPPGTGKSETMRWISEYCVDQFDRESYKLSYAKLYELLQNGVEINTDRTLIFIDDIDASLLRDRREPNSNPLTSQFLTCLDGIDKREGRVIVMSTNEDIGKIDPALRRPGRFENVIKLEYPDIDLIREFCDTRGVSLNPELLIDWSFARIDLFVSRFKVAQFLHGATIEGFYEKFIHEMGAKDETIEVFSCPEAYREL